MSKRVEVIFNMKDGSVVAEAFGFKGPACEEKTEFLKKEFGSSKVTHKPSYQEIELEDKTNIVDGLPEGHCG